MCKFQGALTKSFPLTVSPDHSFSFSWIFPKSSDYKLISHQAKQRERSKLCLYNSSQVQACKQTVSWSNLQGEICKIPARASLLSRVTTRAWTPVCKTPSVESNSTKREAQNLPIDYFFPLKALLNCQLMTKFRAFLHYSHRTFEHQQSWFLASCLLGFSEASRCVALGATESATTEKWNYFPESYSALHT